MSLHELSSCTMLEGVRHVGERGTLIENNTGWLQPLRSVESPPPCFNLTVWALFVITCGRTHAHTHQHSAWSTHGCNSVALKTLSTTPTSLPRCGGVGAACLRSQRCDSSKHWATLSHFLLPQQRQESCSSLRVGGHITSQWRSITSCYVSGVLMSFCMLSECNRQ